MQTRQYTVPQKTKAWNTHCPICKVRYLSRKSTPIGLILDTKVCASEKCKLDTVPQKTKAWNTRCPICKVRYLSRKSTPIGFILDTKIPPINAHLKNANSTQSPKN